MDLFPIIEGIAKRGLENQVIKECDYYGEDGLLVCGVCHEPRQEIAPWKVGDKTVDLKRARSCKCDRDIAEQKKREEQMKEDMEYIARLRELSLMDTKFKNAVFDSFKTNKENERNLKLCKRYATAFDKMMEKAQGLLMWGDVGTGKSFAAACIANYLLDHKTSVIMTSFVKILEIIDKDRDEESAIIARLGRAKLVIFDDLGAERSTDYAIEKVYNIIDSRYRSGLPMILTTNLTLDAMQNETDIRYKRIFDRIFETCYPMQFTGVSWRMRSAYQRFSEMESLLTDNE
ncbi:MAG: ATP-binding protein [Clostridia bacterium]|nr:ATP-binding protein [Clostridia bacterium]